MGYYNGRGDCMYGRGDYYRGDYYQGGDLWGSLKSIGGKILGGVSTVTGAASRLLGQGSSGSVKPPPMGGTSGVSVSTYQPPMIIPPAPQEIAGFHATLGPMSGGISVTNPWAGPQQYIAPPMPQDIPSTLGGPPIMISSDGKVCTIKGTHLNKSTYVTRRGGLTLHPKHSTCVKNRRMNVANPRALRRAIRRAHGFAKLARRVLSYPISKPPKGRALFKSRRRR